MKCIIRLAVSGASVLFLAGCIGGDSGYDYEIPQSLCDVKVAASNIKPLLPPGKEVVVDKSESTLRPGAGRNCSVTVDKRPDLTISISRQGGEVDIAREASDKYVELRRVSLGKEVTSAAVGEDGAVAWMVCVPKPGQPQYESPKDRVGRYGHLALEMRIGKDVERSVPVKEWRTHVENLLRSFVPGLVEDWCE